MPTTAKFWSRIVSATVAFAASGAALAQPIPLGPEFQNCNAADIQTYIDTLD